MQRELNSTRTRGITQEKVGEEGKAIVFGADSPQWMQNLQSEMKKDKARLFSRKELNTLFDKKREGKKLTENQESRYAYLERAIEGYEGEAGEFV